jgi:Protein of unknown function (DUF3631)
VTLSLARKAALTLVTATREREPSLGIQLLRDIKAIFGDSQQIFSRELLLKLGDLEESP